MIMTVDVGNTHIKLGSWDNESLVFVSRLQTNTRKTQDEYAIDLLDILRLNKCNHAQFDGAIIACVVPALSNVIREAVEMVIQSQRVFLISPALKTDLTVKIDNPETLGADMVCAAVAAINRYALPCIIVSLGTATAILAVDGEGGFLGGSVSAGVGISLEALSVRTAQLPHISLEEPAGAIGTNTVDCIKSGIIYGTADMIDGMIRRLKGIMGEEVSVVACGGYVEQVIPHCTQDIAVNPHLVLEGLRLIYHKNA